jgi:sec-independent protein translocase protein TatB
VFNVGGGEIVVILLLALIVLGPERLPDAAKKLGRMMGEVRRMTSGFQEEVRNAMDITGTEDAIHRTEPGPRLLGPPPAAGATRPVTSASPAPAADVPGAETAAPAPDSEPGRGDTSAA